MDSYSVVMVKFLEKVLLYELDCILLAIEFSKLCSLTKEWFVGNELKFSKLSLK